jgi:phospholipase/lecithinase/hemolysin
VVNPTGIPPMVDNISEQLLGASLPIDTGIGYQVGGFLALWPLPALDPNALYVVWGGANDISINPSAPVATQAADNVGALVVALYANGARNFLVPNLPDLGATPGAAGPLAPAITQLGLAYNSRLAGNLTLLGALPGANIVAFDTFSALQNLGPRFANTTQPCVIGNVLFSQYAPYCGPGVEDEFLFWDASHPTGRAHKMLGQQFARAVGVPEPASLLLGALGLAGVAYRRRRAA